MHLITYILYMHSIVCTVCTLLHTHMHSIVCNVCTLLHTYMHSIVLYCMYSAYVLQLQTFHTIMYCLTYISVIETHTHSLTSVHSFITHSALKLCQSTNSVGVGHYYTFSDLTSLSTLLGVLVVHFGSFASLVHLPQVTIFLSCS